MKNTAIVLALVFVLAIGGALFVLAGSKDVPIIEEGTSVESAKLEQTQAERTQLQEELAVAEERIRQLEVDAEETNALVEEMKNDAAESEETDEEAKEEPEEKKNNRDLSVDEIVAKMQKNPRAKAQIQAMTGLVYGDFLNNVDLDPEVKSQVRDLLSDSYLESQALTQYALLQEDVTWKEVTEWGLEERAYLNDQLSSLLPEEAYKSWNEFEANIDSHVLDGTLRNQIKALSGGLTPENYELVMQVAVEEFRAEQVALEQSDTLFTMSENVYYQFRAMETMRERLVDQLSEDQLDELDNFIDFADQALSSQLPKEEKE